MAAVVVVDAVAEDRQVFVHAMDGSDDGGADRKRTGVGDVVEGDLGKTWIDMGFEDVVVVVGKRLDGCMVGVDLHVALLYPVERPYVVDAAHMVAMGVCDEDGVEMGDLMVEHLRPEVGTDIDKDIMASAVDDECGGAQSLVVGVVGVADIAGACYYGHSLRSARS